MTLHATGGSTAFLARRASDRSPRREPGVDDGMHRDRVPAGTIDRVTGFNRPPGRTLICGAPRFHGLAPEATIRRPVGLDNASGTRALLGKHCADSINGLRRMSYTPSPAADDLTFAVSAGGVTIGGLSRQQAYAGASPRRAAGCFSGANRPPPDYLDRTGSPRLTAGNSCPGSHWPPRWYAGPRTSRRL